MLRRAAIGILLVTAAALVVAPLSFYVGARHAHQEYTEEIDRLRRDLLATRQQKGVYLAPERYSSMVGRLEEQERDIYEKTDQLRDLRQEMQKKEVIFAGLKKALKKKTVALMNNEEQLSDIRCKPQKTKESLQLTEARQDEQSHLVAQQDEAERLLTDVTHQPLTTAESAASDLQNDEVDRRRSLEHRNEAVSREFHAQFQTDMARLESSLETAFQMQRAFCTQMYANLGAAVERRKHEVASLTNLLSALLGSQTEQLRELEAHAQSEAAGQHAWIGAQLSSVAARRQAQADTQTVLQQQLAAGAEAVLARLAQLDVSAEQRQTELRRWLQQHDDGLRDALIELREMVRQRERQLRLDADERVAALQADNQRLVDRQANLTGRIESLQASLAAVGTALAASTSTAQDLAAAAAEDGAAAEAAMAAEQTRLEQMRRAATEFHTAAGQRLERAQTQLAEETDRLETLLLQRDAEVSQQTGEARGQLERARDVWTPTLTELTAGWDEHCQRQEVALRARSEAVNGGLQHAQKRVQNLAASLHGAVRGSDQLMEAQSRGFFATIRERQEELTDECARIETQAAAIGEMVRRRDNEVEVFVLETLHRDVTADSSPRRRRLSYQRYRLARADRTRQSDQAHIEPSTDLSYNGTELLTSSGNVTKAPSPPSGDVIKAPSPPSHDVTEAPPDVIRAPSPPSRVTGPSDLRPLRAPSLRDVSDAGSGIENKGSERVKQKARDKSAAPATRRQQRRSRRARRLHMTRRTPRLRARGVWKPNNG